MLVAIVLCMAFTLTSCDLENNEYMQTVFEGDRVL